MYAIDPSEIPSHAAYQIGVRLGQQLLEKHLNTSGSLPESTAFVLYSGDQMRTHGEDIGEILWLMGLRPQWLRCWEKMKTLMFTLTSNNKTSELLMRHSCCYSCSGVETMADSV